MLSVIGQRRDSRGGSLSGNVCVGGIDGPSLDRSARNGTEAVDADRRHQSIERGVPGLPGGRYGEVLFANVRDRTDSFETQLAFTHFNRL